MARRNWEEGSSLENRRWKESSFRVKDVKYDGAVETYVPMRPGQRKYGPRSFVSVNFFALGRGFHGAILGRVGRHVGFTVKAVGLRCS